MIRLARRTPRHVLALSLLLALGAPARAATPARTDTLPPPRTAAASAFAPTPLFVDPSDMGFGSSVIFTRVPNVADIEGLSYYDNVQHVVLALPAWPEEWAAIAPLSQVILPREADLVVFLRGYPPSRAAAAAWNSLRQRLRIILLVDGPPADRGAILELNSLRGLERVVATMDHPARSGFERLQRPLSFRVVMP